MLQSIHDKLKGWLAGVILGAIGLVFVFWGINWTLSAPTYAAKVNGVEISANEVRSSYQQQLAQAERQTNGNLTDAQRNDIKKRVLEDYVNSEAMVTRADELGYRVGDRQVLAEMQQVPAFQVNGKFDYGHALALLRAQGRSPAEIEELFRRDVKLRQLDLALNTSSFTTPTELKEVRAIMEQQRELAWQTLSAAKYADAATPDDQQLSAYYEAHKADYMTPETVSLHYVEISLGQLADKVKVDEAQLKAFYDEQKAKNPERFSTPEQRRVSHILLQVSSPKDDGAVKAKAEGVLKRAQSGEDFAKLARENSQDPGSKDQGGDLGWSEKRVFVAPFAEAAWSMKEGDIKGPVKTEFGYHILKLDGIKPASTKTFEEARADLETEYKRSEAERLYNDTADKLADASLQSSSDLEQVAKKTGLEVKSVDGFSRANGGGALGKVQAVIDAAFSQDVLDGRLSSIVEVDKGRGVVMHATDHKLPQQKSFDSVKAEVLTAWKKQRGVELAAQAGADAVKRLNGGESWDAVAKGLGQPPMAPKFVSRADNDVPFELRTFSFSAAKPKDGKPTYESVALANGDSVLYELIQVREDPKSEATQDDGLKRQYASRIASDEAQSYAIGVRAQAKVTLNPQVIE